MKIRKSDMKSRLTDMNTVSFDMNSRLCDMKMDNPDMNVSLCVMISESAVLQYRLAI